MLPIVQAILLGILEEGLAWTEEGVVAELAPVHGRAFTGRSNKGWTLRVLTFDARAIDATAAEGARGVDACAIGPNGTQLRLPSDLASVAATQAERTFARLHDPEADAALATEEAPSAIANEEAPSALPPKRARRKA